MRNHTANDHNDPNAEPPDGPPLCPDGCGWPVGMHHDPPHAVHLVGRAA